MLDNTTTHLREYAQSIEQLSNDMAYELAQLRENIRLAREQANSVSSGVWKNSLLEKWRHGKMASKKIGLLEK